MHVVVMGAGGVGGYFGGKLARSGADVTFVARGPHLEAIKASGLAVHSIDGDFSVKATAVADLGGQPVADAVLFCVKSFDTDDAAARLRPVIGPETAVLSLQNGVDNEERIDAAVGAGHALGGAAYVFATIEAPGVIRHAFGGRVTFGEMDGKIRTRTERLHEALAGAGIPVELVPDIRRVLWEKYLFIAAQAGMTAMTRTAIGRIREVPETWAMYRRILEELFAVAEVEQVGLRPDTVDAILGAASALAPGATSSLHHDLTQGKRLELEALHGHGVRLGERNGVPTPMLFAVYAALKPHALSA